MGAGRVSDGRWVPDGLFLGGLSLWGPSSTLVVPTLVVPTLYHPGYTSPSQLHRGAACTDSEASAQRLAESVKRVVSGSPTYR